MDNLEEETQIGAETIKYLWNIARKTSETCPSISRYYMFNLKRSLDASSTNVKGIKEHEFCKHCGSLWSSSNHKVRIQPPTKKNNHIKKLLKWESEQPWRLNCRQKKKISKYRESTNKIVYICLCCKKTTDQPCFKRRVKTEEKITSLYQLPSKIKSKKRDLNAGLLIHSQKKNVIPSKQEKESATEVNPDQIKPYNTKVMNNGSPSLPFKESKLPSYKLHSLKNTSANNYSHTQTDGNLNNSSKKTKKKLLLAQILKQEREAGKQTSGLSSFLVSI